ncbi:hypothetical protein OIU77_005394 [Salix suchowensis]|uniref:Uncharacterized protein n=1 Tax=Salix suchowensis TaxID=1278906 RepID=A0ABQ9APF8_9ROSI|nr:hypothetical protein OIU77_005394 [Salix suchowensis]
MQILGLRSLKWKIAGNWSVAGYKKEGPNHLNLHRQLDLLIPLIQIQMVPFLDVLGILKQNHCCSFWNFHISWTVHQNQEKEDIVLVLPIQFREVLLFIIVKIFLLMMWTNQNLKKKLMMWTLEKSNSESQHIGLCWKHAASKRVAYHRL